MNFKIENNFLNITNYPSVEKHLEDMASKGWLLSKIILGNIFIYKKITPEQLDFSISPYEVETAFTRKSKDELNEFRSVCKSVGWNYCTKSYDLHIYFKKKDSEALDIHTDEEEEFRSLEHIAKKQINGYFFQIPILLLICWFNLGGLATSVYSMQDGLNQLVVPLILIAIIISTVGLIHIKRFLRVNRRNIDLGKEVEYSDSKFYFYRITFFIFFLNVFLFIIYILYASICLKNKIILFALFPGLIAIIIGTLYRIFIKPSKKTLRYKKIGFVVVIALAVVISSAVGVFSIMNLVNNRNNPNVDRYKVLLNEHFTDEDLTSEGDLRENASILIPKSYKYYSRSTTQSRREHLETDYSKALTKEIAHNLVNRYKKEVENALIGRYSRELEFSFNEGSYVDYLSETGFTIKDFNNLKEKEIKKALKAAQEIIRERSIVKDNENLWNVDEAYFLKYDKTEIVLRKGKEVFYLEGKDFSDIEVIKISKEKLGLDRGTVPLS